ncbi:MAG TPA: NlpC/P60 family protein [Actinomycetota bacterium]|nr:NlpC/P60 family protein [Actinomycetota bacterium]
MPPARRSERRGARRLGRTTAVAALAVVLLAAPASAAPADPGGARVGPWVAGPAQPGGALLGPGAPTGPGAPARAAAPAAGRKANAVPVGGVSALRAEATRLRTKLDTQNRRLELLAEELEEAYARGVKLLAEASGLDARRRAAERELAAAQKELDERARSAYIAGPGYFVSGLIGAADPADALARLPLQRAILEADLALVDRVERAKGKLDDTRSKLSARLVEQAQAAAGLDAKRVEAEKLAAEITGELRTMDRRVGALIEQQRRREEAQQRASFTRFMDAARAKGLAAEDGRASAAAMRAVAVALAQMGAPYRWGAEGPGEFDCSGLTSFAYAKAGVTIPRVSRAQFAAYAGVRAVDRMQLVAGDLVFFADNPRDPSTIHHVGMYIGRGLMVEAPYTGAVVRTSSIWRSSYAGAVRPAP